jgi:tetratricopeptide (TPR) repeat protein
MPRTDPEELFNAAKEYFIEGHYKVVEPMIQQLMIIDDKNPEVHYMAGTLFFEKGQMKRALNSFKRSLEIDPNFTDSSIGLSIILNDLGRYNEGQRVFEEAYALMKQKDASGNEPYVNEKLAIKHEELGDLYFLYKRFEEALENYNKAADFSKNRLNYKLKAIDCLIHMKLLSRALKEAQILEKNHPNKTDLLLKMAQIHYQMSQSRDAEDYWERVLSLDPSNIEAKSHLKHAQKELYINL